MSNSSTWGPTGPHRERKDVLPATEGSSFTCNCTSVTSQLQSLGISIIRACPVKCHFYCFFCQQLVLRSKKNKTNKLSNIQYIDLVKKFRELWDIRGHPDSSFSLDTEYCQQSKDPTWSSLSSFWIHVHQFLSMYGYSQCLGLVSLFLKNTKHKDILNKITHLNKQ